MAVKQGKAVFWRKTGAVVFENILPRLKRRFDKVEINGFRLTVLLISSRGPYGPLVRNRSKQGGVVFWRKTSDVVFENIRPRLKRRFDELEMNGFRLRVILISSRGPF